VGKIYSEIYVLFKYSEYVNLDFLYTEPTNTILIVNYYVTSSCFNNIVSSSGSSQLLPVEVI